MKIILQKDYPRLGSALDVLEVKDGYARNYLIPQGIALPATSGNLRHAEEMQKYNAKRVERNIEAAQKLAAKIAGHSCTIPVKVKEGEDIFGSVTVQDILDNFAAAKIEIQKPSVLLSEPIKKLGTYDVEIKLHKTVSETVKVIVVNEAPTTDEPVEEPAKEEVVEEAVEEAPEAEATEEA